MAAIVPLWFNDLPLLLLCNVLTSHQTVSLIRSAAVIQPGNDSRIDHLKSREWPQLIYLSINPDVFLTRSSGLLRKECFPVGQACELYQCTGGISS